MHAVIAVALPVFAVIAAGLLAGRLKLASAEDSAALNRFVFRFAMPAALFGLMSGASGLRRDDLLLALCYGAPALAAILGAYVLARTLLRLDAPTAGAHAFASVIGNAVFLGLPIAVGIEGWSRPFVVLMLVEGIVVIGIGAALMAAPMAAPGPNAGAAARFDAGGFLLRPLKNPLVIAALLGFAVASAGVMLAPPIRAFFDILGRAAGPAALFSLGLFLATRPAPRLFDFLPNIAAIALVKMALLPLAALMLLQAFGVADPAYRGALALFTATPTAVGAFIMASQYGRYVEEAAAAIAITTALAAFSIGAVLIVFA